MGQNRLMCPQCYAWPLNATGYLMIKTQSSQEWELQQEKSHGHGVHQPFTKDAKLQTIGTLIGM